MSLFLFARDRCDGRESVKEIGDFVAHHDERYKGPVTRSVSDWFHIVKYFCSQPNKFGPPPVNRLPSNSKEYFEAAMRRSTHADIKKAVGIGRAEAYRLMPKVFDALQPNGDGTYRPVTPDVTVARLMQFFHSRFAAPSPPFTDERLCEDFICTLKSHSVINKEEMHEFRKLKTLIALYAVTQMHNCKIKIDDGPALTLLAMPLALPGYLGVNATIPTSAEPGAFSVSTSIFTTNLDSVEYINSSLLEMRSWDFDLEIGPDKKLTALC